MPVRANQFVFEVATRAATNVRCNQFVFEAAILPLGPTISCNNPPNGGVGAPYTHTFSTSGGTLPFVFAIVAGTLPPGVELNASTGVAAGTPNLAGEFTFTVRVTDSALLSSEVECSITVVGAPVQPISGGGPPKAKGGCKKDNSWDACITDEIYRTRRITFPPSCSIPKEFCNLLPWDDTFGAIPYQAVPFNVIGSIATPDPADGDQLVCQGKVPYGYDGLLTGIYQTFQGGGYNNGSGDIVWRIQLNQRYLFGLSNNPYAMGNSQQPIPLTDGQILLSGQTFRYFVNVPNTSGGVIIAGSSIVCGLLGFYWPR